ncbi:uncharacterized protein J4E78_005078 [Alternaria triticimaculans]|uniref:uncharacterized protein n=1 Tax=Alternaria triticimaculans TaxID=297637 RepID=UPI0020C4B97C|nr:uncharacterized protein J4E78_005078 [Alternaria triticimaculans]KAI4660375.1 hypothetical protein J4E78_005078 [Alternaria triticimaculans]
MAHQREPRMAKINKKQKQRLQAQEKELSLETEQEAKAQETQHYNSASDSDSSETVRYAPTSILKHEEFASPATTKLRRKMWLSLSAHVELSKLLEAAKSSSDHHFDTWSNPKTLRRDPELTQDGWEKAIEQQYQTWYDDTVKKLSAEVDAHSYTVRQWQITEEHGNMPKSETLPLIVQAETTTAGLRKLLIILRGFKNQMRGEYTDAHQHSDATDMAYINSMIQRLTKPYQSPQVHKSWYKGPDGRDLDAPQRFDKDASDYYGGSIFTDNIRLWLHVWCPIAWQRTGVHPWPHDTGAIHLVHYNTGDHACDYLFGKTDSTRGHLMDPSNGLFLGFEFKRMLNRAQIIIVPASVGDTDPETGKKVQETDKEPYKVRVLDPKLRNGDGDLRYRTWPVAHTQLDGRILEFANDNRPKKMYLWYRAVLNIAVRHRLQAPGWEGEIEALGQNSWCAPGESLRRSTMAAILKHVGFIDDPEPIFALGPTLKGPPEEGTNDRSIADRVAMVLDTTHTNWLKSRRSAFASMHAGKEVEIDWEDEAQEQHHKFASRKLCLDAGFV